ncbi:hypothetical protein amad1_08125 [Alteromonas mediterranea DE1]|uniref:Uncharacterized protein n=1 Tax=Alteromonas mediterranea 615 TaxID=1300253 RepID=S5AG27_9ALTE|nr:hypothetical protein amad1_08125 [Alteromonas mediterranea DE1]AGP77716.1 hypothetical protein I633_08240 [Alteromonas mediterranea 615]AGP97147.1 hypothetical protein I635_08115 [Alteromonas mediterranea UM7]AGQ01491.1 hypothetical protein I636_08185 [Alteromonas mediterranea UM4b]
MALFVAASHKFVRIFQLPLYDFLMLALLLSGFLLFSFSEKQRLFLLDITMKQLFHVV